MQSGKNKSQQDRAMNRGAAKATRNVEEKRRTIAESGRFKQEVKTSSTAVTDDKETDAETKRKPQAPAVNRNKPKVITYSKTDENRVSYSIQKLLSVYQSNTKSDKSPDGRHSHAVENKKPKEYAKPSRNNATKIPEIQGSPKNAPANTYKTLKRRFSPAQRVNTDVKESGFPSRKLEEAHARKTIPKPKLSPERGKAESPPESVETEAPDKEVKQCDEIIPLLTPDRTAHSPINQIQSFIANYLEEDSDNRCDNKNKLKFFVPENNGNAFPVCSKRATDNIPSSDLVRPEVVAPSTRELIIMLRRRNSEPYSPKSCILQYSRREEDHPLSSVGSDAWRLGYENYYFWEQGPIHPSKPYWEVSLFKSNKSSSALDSGAGLLPLTPSKNTSEILINGDFGLGNRERAILPDRVLKSWNSDLHSCKSLVRTTPCVSSIQVMASLPCEPAQVETATKPEARSPGISKDDHYKHPAHLLVYVKSSQKKLVSLDSRGNRDENSANRKVHKIKKILGGVSEARSTSSCKNIIFAVVSAVLFLTGGFAFFAYVLARRSTFFNLTPPIPELLRRC